MSREIGSNAATQVIRLNVLSPKTNRNNANKNETVVANRNTLIIYSNSNDLS